MKKYWKVISVLFAIIIVVLTLRITDMQKEINVYESERLIPDSCAKVTIQSFKGEMLFEYVGERIEIQKETSDEYDFEFIIKIPNIYEEDSCFQEGE